MRRLVLKCVWSLPGGCHDENNNLDEKVLIMMTMTIVMVLIMMRMTMVMVTMMPVMMMMTTALKLGQFEACLSDRIETMPWAL